VLFRSTSRIHAVTNLEKYKAEGKLLTGLLYVDQHIQETHDIINTTLRPLNTLGEVDLCPGNAALQKINESFR
jgi:2-oxoglutarate ferredoxin oxidoreductase subunit beta